MPQPLSAKPMYQKVRERLERDISSGRYAAGEKFPSEAALVQRFGASRITVGRAVRELQERGLLDRVAGSGTYVRGAAPRPKEGLLFGLVIPNLGETEIFEPICTASPRRPRRAGTHCSGRTPTKARRAAKSRRSSWRVTALRARWRAYSLRRWSSARPARRLTRE